MAKTVFRVHALGRMFERHVSVDDVKAVIDSGELVKDYPDDFPYPSRLLLGWVAGRPLHVVAAHNAANDETIIVTVYEPDPNEWEPGLKRRKP